MRMPESSIAMKQFNNNLIAFQYYSGDGHPKQGTGRDVENNEIEMSLKYRQFLR